MAVTKIQVEKRGGSGFLGVLGDMLSTAGTIASTVPIPGVQAAGQAAQTIGTIGKVAQGVGAAAKVVNSVAGGDSSSKNLTQSTPQIKPTSAAQEITAPSKQLQDAIQAASQIPEYQDRVPELLEAFDKQQRKDFLAMRRGG